MGSDPTTGELKIRLDHNDVAIADLRADLNTARTEMRAVADALVQTNLASATNHATTQAQNVAILERLNRPSVILSILGNPAIMAGLAGLIGTLVAAATAMGYATAPNHPVPVVVPVAQHQDATP